MTATRSGSSGEPRLLGLGQHRPPRVLTNDELAMTLDTDDTWIRERTGIRQRHLAADDAGVVTMAADASAKALADAGVDAADVDLVVVATCTMPTSIPGAAAQVASALGVTRAGAFDINAACAGFCYGLSVAADAVRSGSARHVVVVGAEKLSDWVDWSDRRSAILFGDGAGAAVVGRAGAGQSCGIGPVVWGSDGARAELIDVPVGGKLRLDGPAVFRWATTSLADVARAACAAADVEPADLAAFVPHQANMRIVEAVARRLGATQAVVADDIVDTGNTSAASVPLALGRLRDEGRVATGDRALLLAFGAGLTWAGQVVDVC
ncbi:MAG TPA: beta-ketoacyl-ACP synthase III [Mycobacteriales bacterium]|nr:beta-ketoacyl-ACP synthase III [Mycobacteriales bacterium]